MLRSFSSVTDLQLAIEVMTKVVHEVPFSRFYHKDYTTISKYCNGSTVQQTIVVFKSKFY